MVGKRKLAGPASVRNKKLKAKKSESLEKTYSKREEEQEQEQEKEKEEVSESSSAVVIKKEIEDGDSSAIIDKISTLDEDISEEEKESRASEGQSENLLEIVRKTLLSEVLATRKLVEENLSSKTQEINALKEKNASLESQNAELATKYRKYKDLASSLAKKTGSGNVKQLQEENNDLKSKLKSYVEDLQSQQDRQEDTGSKLAMKDVLLQKERSKFEDLECKFKKFLKVVNEKSDRMPDTFIARVKTSLEESQISENLTDKKIVPDFIEKMNGKLKGDRSPEEETQSQKKSNKVEAVKKPVNSPASSAVAGHSIQRSDKRSSQQVSGSVSLEKKAVSEDTRESSDTLNTSNTRSRRANTGRRSTPSASTGSGELSSKLLANSSISIGKTPASTKSSVEPSEETPTPPKASLSKLNKLKNSTLSISTSVAVSKAPAPVKTSISMTKTGEANSSPAEKDSGKMLRSSGISLSKVNTAVTKSESPKKSSSTTPSRLDALKKLNISIGKSSGTNQEDGASDQSSPSPSVSDNRSLALVPPSGSDRSNKRASKTPSGKRGPASARRKLKESEKPVTETQLALTSSLVPAYPSLQLADDFAVESVLASGEEGGDLLSIDVDDDFMKGLESEDDFSLLDRIDCASQIAQDASHMSREDKERMKQLEEDSSSEKLLAE